MKELLQPIIETITPGAVIVVLCAMLIMAASAIDFVTGIRRARKKKERIYSGNIRKTIKKDIEYILFMLLGTLIDCLGLLTFYEKMYVTVIITACVIIIEGKSVFENLRKQNSKVKDIPLALTELLENKERLDEVIKVLKNKENE